MALALTNPTAAEHNVTVVNNRSLSGRYGALRVVHSHVGAIVLEWRDRCDRSRMIIPDLHECFEGAAGITDPGYNVPIHVVELELLAEQVIGIANDDAICCRIEIDDITRTGRTAGQPFALSDREQLNAAMFTEEISSDVVDFAAVKFIFTQVRTQ